MKLSELNPNPKNPRKISDEQLERMKKSYYQFGSLHGFIFNRRSKQLIGGHQSQKVLPEDSEIVLLKEFSEPTKTGTVAVGHVVIEDEMFPYREVDVDELTEKTMNIAANKHGGEFEIGILKDWIIELDEFGIDLDLTGFSNQELEILVAPIFQGGLTDEDSVPQIPEEPKTKLGDLYKLGNHKLMCGDSTMIDEVEKLMDGEKADMVFTDPPYGYQYQSNYQNKHQMLENDDKILDFLPCAYAAMSENSALYVCGSHQTIHLWRPLIDQHFTYKNLIVWKKNNWSMGDLTGDFAGQHELIIFAHKGRVEIKGERSRNVWEFDRDPPEDHPTQKPIPLVSFAIEKVTGQGSSVLDLFGGSGSTLIAAEKINRKCFMMELDPKYCDVIVSRWEKYTGQKAELLTP